MSDETQKPFLNKEDFIKYCNAVLGVPKRIGSNYRLDEIPALDPTGNLDSTAAIQAIFDGNPYVLRGKILRRGDEGYGVLEATM